MPSGLATIVAFVAALVLGAGCSERSIELAFVVPDGHTGILKLRGNRRYGMVPQPTNGVVRLVFNRDGICDIQGVLPTFKWHRVAARFATAGAIRWVQFPDQTEASVVGLRALGPKGQDEDWYIVGDLAAVRSAMDIKYGFKVPLR
jgi:hypothetical protein